MKEISRDLKQGILTLLPEHSDDLFLLSDVILSGDMVEALTTRKIKIDRGGEERKGAIATRTIQLSIRVEKTEFTGETLRISGTVMEGKEDIPRQSHHTITMEPHQKITIIKTSWPSYILNRLQEALEGKPPRILILNLDRDEAYLALMQRQSYQILSHHVSQQSKKAIPQPEQDFYQFLADAIVSQDETHHFDAILIASPAFFKDEVLKRLAPTLRAKTILCTSSSVGKNGIDEVLKRPEIITALSTARTGQELALVDKLLLGIKKGQATVIYGISSCQRAAESGAIQILLITTGLIVRKRTEHAFETLQALMNAAEATGATVTIISSEHEGGQRLDGLGGIGALLRYPLVIR